MKEVRIKRLRDHFKLDDQYKIFSNFYYRNYQIFNRVTFIIFIFLFSSIVGFFKSYFFAIPLSLAFFLLYLYFRTKLIVRGLEVERKCPVKAQVDDVIIVAYSLHNNSLFSLHNFFVSDVFEASKQKIEKKYVTKTISRGAGWTYNYKRSCDGGMGKKRIGPLTILLSDPLGIFEYEIIFDSREELVVYPKIEQLKPFPVRGTSSSIRIGLYDMYIKGNSTNFYGIRDYVKGDPLNFIHWKLSLRNRGLVVKEFEKNVNAYVSIIMDMDKELHMGKGSESTWEYMKDLSLSIASQQLSLGNDLQLMANNEYIPFGRGEDFIRFLEIIMTSLHPEDDQSNQSLIGKYFDKIPHGSTVFYLSPVISHDKFIRNIKSIKKLQVQGNQVFCLLIEGISYMQQITDGDQKEYFKKIHRETIRKLATLTGELEGIGIKTNLILVKEKRKKYSEYIK